MKHHNNPVQLVKTTIQLDIDIKNEKEHDDDDAEGDT